MPLFAGPAPGAGNDELEELLSNRYLLRDWDLRFAEWCRDHWTSLSVLSQCEARNAAAALWLDELKDLRMFR